MSKFKYVFHEDRTSSEAHAMPSLWSAKSYLPDSSVGVKEASVLLVHLWSVAMATTLLIDQFEF